MSRRRLISTPDAVLDLDAIWDYVAQDSELAADRVIDELGRHFELLLQFPEIGELQPLLADGIYRRSVVRGYVVYYRAEPDGITLARVFHGARDHEQLL
jgi:toxin ParE1/3/4